MLSKLQELWDDRGDELSVVLVFTLIIGLVLWGLSTAAPVTVTGVVIDKMYSPSTLSTGIGSVDGKPIVVTGGRGEKWSLVIRDGAEVYSYEVSVSIYYSVEIGQRVAMECSTILGMAECSNGELK